MSASLRLRVASLLLVLWGSACTASRDTPPDGDGQGGASSTVEDDGDRVGRGGTSDDMGLAGSSTHPEQDSAPVLEPCEWCSEEIAGRPSWTWIEGASEVEDEASALFSQGAPIQIHVTIDEEEWKALNANAIERDNQKIYSSAQVSLGELELGEIGIRPKGGNGTLRSCFNKKGELLCDKLSYKLKFSKFDKKLRFLGLARLNLHSSHSDDSLIRETLAYGLYRRMGVPAPRTHYAELYVNGEQLGLYVLVEQVDKSFLKSRFPGESSGNLYKNLWPAGRSESKYDQALRTNEKYPDHGSFLRFGEDLNSASDEELPDVLGRWLDGSTFDRTIAVEEGLVNWDGALSFRVRSDDMKVYDSQNFYFYQRRPDLFVFIPWDLDHAFWKAHPHVKNMPSPRDLSADCKDDWGIPSDDGERSYLVPSCEPLIRALALSEHQNGVRLLRDGPFSVKEMHATIDWNVERLNDAVERDSTINEKEWLSDVKSLRKSIEVLGERMDAAKLKN